MNLWFRLIWLLMTQGSKARIALHEEVAIRYRVLPTDLDLNGHMTNSRYLAIMDLVALELMARLGLLKVVLRRRWRPVLGGTLTTHRRSLKPFEVYTVRARVVYWDERWSFIEHRFERDGEVLAVGLGKSVFLGPDGAVPIDTVLGHLAGDLAKPECPEAVLCWIAAEARLFGALGAASGCTQAVRGERPRKGGARHRGARGAYPVATRPAAPALNPAR